MRLALVSALLLGLAACSQPADLGPPEGWVTDGADRWVRAGADTTGAFRDLSTIAAMGAVREDDTEFVRWTQEELTQLYRTNPEIVDSVFGAVFIAEVRSGAPAGDDYETAARSLVNDIKGEFYQRYNPPQKVPRAEGIVVPDSLTSVSGTVVVQVRVNAEQQPVAIELLEGTGTALDALVMRDAALSEYTSSWVRRTAGRSEGTPVSAWLRVQQGFGS